MTPKENSEKLIKKYTNSLESIVDYNNYSIGWSKEMAIKDCGLAIDVLQEYHNHMLEINGETESEALVYETRIKFWLDTKKELKK